MSGIVLQLGDNVINVAARDGAGNVTTSLITVNYLTPDVAAPTIGITFPTSEATFQTSDAQVNLAGTASDDRGIAQIAWSNDRGGQGTASGTTVWTANGVALQIGVNVITVTAADSAGNNSSAVLEVSYQPRQSAIQLSVIGNGQIKGVLDGAVLFNDHSYTLQAKPGRGQVFAGWSGDLVSNDATLTFVMQEGLEIAATFIADPFTEILGTFTGLIRAEPQMHESTGLLRVTVSKLGAFSGRMILGGVGYAVKGSFDSNGQWVGQIPREKKSPLSLLLALDLSGGSETVNGLLSDGAFTAAINTSRAAIYTASDPAPQQGRFTLSFPADVAHPEATYPRGAGYGRLTVTSTGKVKIGSTLGDTTPMNFGGALNERGEIPLYVPLYSAKGSVSGWLTMDKSAMNHIEGTLTWFKPPTKTPNWYPAEFSGEIEVEGSSYVAPPVQPQILPAGPATFTISGGNVSVKPATKDLTIDAQNKIKITGDEKFTMTLAPTTGLLAGTFLDEGKKPRTFKGAVLQKQNRGAGLFKGSGQAGSVILQPTQ